MLQVETQSTSASAPNSRSSSRISEMIDEDATSSSKLVRSYLAQKGLQKYEPQFEKHSIRPSQLKVCEQACFGLFWFCFLYSPPFRI